MEVRINKEVRNYQESLFFGLSLRQFLFALLAVLVALAVYFCLHPVLGTGEIGWVCILAAFPFALGGFFTYNGMTLERFLMAYIRSEFFMPKRLLFRTEDLYVKLMEHTSIADTCVVQPDSILRRVCNHSLDEFPPDTVLCVVFPVDIFLRVDIRLKISNPVA